MNKKFLAVCDILKEFSNCAAGITGVYETPARPFKSLTTPEKKRVVPLKSSGSISKRNKKKGY